MADSFFARMKSPISGKHEHSPESRAGLDIDLAQLSSGEGAMDRAAPHRLARS